MKLTINGITPEGGLNELFSVSHEEGKILVDNTGTLDIVYLGDSLTEAKEFYEAQLLDGNIVWH